MPDKRATAVGWLNKALTRRRMARRAKMVGMLAEAYDDITDGDNNTLKASRLINRLQTLMLYEHDTDGYVMDGDFSGAKQVANEYFGANDEAVTLDHAKR